jgi:uncharacterized membrane protein
MDLFMICICLVGLTCLGALSGAIVRRHGYNLLRWHGVILTAACLIAFVVFVYGNEFSRWPLISASALIIGYATGLALFWNRTPWNDRRNFVYVIDPSWSMPEPKRVVPLFSLAEDEQFALGQLADISA